MSFSSFFGAKSSALLSDIAQLNIHIFLFYKSRNDSLQNCFF